MIRFLYKNWFYDINENFLLSCPNSLFSNLYDCEHSKTITLTKPFLDMNDKKFELLLNSIMKYYETGDMYVPKLMTSLELKYKLNYFLIDVNIEDFKIDDMNKMQHLRCISMYNQDIIFNNFLNILMDVIFKHCKLGHTECNIILLTDDDTINDMPNFYTKIYEYVENFYLFFQCQNNRNRFCKFAKRHNLNIIWYTSMLSFNNNRTSFHLSWFNVYSFD